MKIKNPISPLVLVILIPLLSIIMGTVTLYLALQSPEAAVDIVDEPLSKTSWRDKP
ncbi:MAG: hypothetical protein HKN70_14225 [Gammaproteobacteria bacterium]|nr:hypothetical protein [Gammaproteobacteria bacterium]